MDNGFDNNSMYEKIMEQFTRTVCDKNIKRQQGVKEIAEISGCSVRSVQDYIHGDAKIPPLFLFWFCVWSGCSADYIIGLED